MTQPESHYTQAEQDEIFVTWANTMAAQDPELTEELAQGIVKKIHCTNVNVCHNTIVYRSDK